MIFPMVKETENFPLDFGINRGFEISLQIR